MQGLSWAPASCLCSLGGSPGNGRRPAAGQGHRAGQEEGLWVGFISWHPCLPRAPVFWWLFPPHPQPPWLSGQLAWNWNSPTILCFGCLSTGPFPGNPTDLMRILLFPPPHPTCVTLGMSLCQSMPWFSLLEKVKMGLTSQACHEKIKDIKSLAQ